MDAFVELLTERVAVMLADLQNDFSSPDVSNQACRDEHPQRTDHEAGRHVRPTHGGLTPRVAYARQGARPGTADTATSTLGAPERALRGFPGRELFLPPIPGAAVVVEDRFDSWQTRSSRTTSTTTTGRLDGRQGRPRLPKVQPARAGATELDRDPRAPARPTLAVPSWERTIRVLVMWLAVGLFGRDVVSLVSAGERR